MNRIAAIFAVLFCLALVPCAPAEEESRTGSGDERIRSLVDSMTLREKVAQMIVVRPEVLAGVSGPVTVAREATREAFDRCPVGGIIYMGSNLKNPEQVKQLCSDMQKISMDRIGLPVFLCVDEEGGTVARVSGNRDFGISPVPRMSKIGAAGDPEKAREAGEKIGTYLSGLGFNVDFAPVADVLTNPKNTVVRARSFGSDPELVTEMTGAFFEGLSSKGVLACYKHFPGHGATAEDSHKGFAASKRTLEQLRQSELVPFQDAADRGVPFIMSGHITAAKVTGKKTPASLSPELLTGLLREEMGYDGIIITDSLSMGAITKNYSLKKAAVMAVLAGNDMLLMPGSLKTCVSAIVEAVEEGEIPEERIDEAVCRIIRAKLQMD